MTRTFKILSCDGGGIRGLLTAFLLENLEQEIQQLDPSSTLTSCFDFFAGTSTGSIIACALAKGMSAEQIRGFYEEKGEKIFPTMDPMFWAKEALEHVVKGHFSLPLFQPNGFEAVLSSPEIFPNSLLFGSLIKPTLIMSYDTYNREAVVFKSKEEKFATVPVWQVCRSSSAAPIAFPAYLLKNEQFLQTLKGKTPTIEGEGNLRIDIPSQGIPLIDGGVVANNPTLCAIAEGVSEANGIDLKNILVASFGTGQMERRITPDEATTWGGLAWSDLMRGIPLYEVCCDGSADAIDYIAEKLLHDRYCRYQPVIDPKVSTFQANKENLDLLRDAAKIYLEKGGQLRLKKLAKMLINS